MATHSLGGLLQHLRRAALRGNGLPDGQLLECFVRRRDEAAFEALVRRHGPMVWGVCRRVLRNEADTEDAFQATFLVLVRKAAALADPTGVGNWLYGVAHRTALKAKAMNRQRRAKEQQAGTPLCTAPSEAGRQELQALLDEALSRLPDKYRAPIVLCDLEGKPLKEAAAQLGCPPGTVASRLARARAMLAKRLARSGQSLAGGAVAAALAHEASACVPPALVASTVQAATAVAAGPGVISTKVIALTEGVVKAMLLTKLKALTAMLVAVTLLGSGGGLLTYHTLRAAAKDAKPRGRVPVGAPKDEKAIKVDAKSDKEKIQGTWTVVSVKDNGQESSADELKGLTMVITHAKLVLKGVRGEEREFTYQLDPAQKPKWIDVADGEKKMLGIYELDGDSLKICLNETPGGERSTEFVSEAGTANDQLMILKRGQASDGRESPAAAPEDEQAKPDKEALQGTWVGVSGERDGQKLPEEAYWELIIAEDKVALITRKGGEERKGSYTLDPDKKPKEIDLTFGSLVITGIYELKETTLKTLWRENDRAGLPTEFDSRKGILMVFEKKK
jgi:RNA polymerase sigma factor (sigma-70 family)